MALHRPTLLLPVAPMEFLAPTMDREEPLGTTGFDVVGSWGWLRVEVPEAS